MKLTVKQVEKAIQKEVDALPGRDKPYKHSVGEGLYVYMPPTGKGVWRFDYRWQGKVQTQTIGATKLFTYLEAMVEVDKTKKLIALNKDPRIVRAPKQKTFADACRQYWGPRADDKTGYRAEALRGLELHLIPGLGKHNIRDITKELLLDHLLPIKGKATTVRRVRMWASQVWREAVEHGFAEADVAAAISPKDAFGKKPRKEGFAWIKDPKVQKQFFRRLASENETIGRLATQLLALTWLRTGELRGLELQEIDFERRVWTVPAERMKKGTDGQPHWVPLSDQALRVIQRLIELKRPASPYLLPHPRKDDRTISENAILSVIADIGFAGQQTGHGFRKMGSTFANERKAEHGWDKDAIEIQLAHMERDESRSSYNYAEYLEQRRVILQAWGDWVEAQSQPVQA